MAGEVKTCTKCGNNQAIGDFCERCGTRLSVVAVAPPVSAAPTALPVATPVEAPTVAQVSPDQAQQPAPPPYEYAAQPMYVAPREPGPFSKLFDFSFQGFVTRDSMRVLFTATLVLLGAYWLFALIFGIVAAVKLGGYWCIGIFSSLILVTLMILWTRIMMELTMSVAKTREDIEAAAQAKTKETVTTKVKK